MAKAHQPHKVILTYEDYQHFPNDGNRYEILEGEVFVTPAPKTKHQLISGNLFVLLESYVRAKKLGRVFFAPVDVVLSRTSVVQPDLLYLSNDRMHLLTEKNVQGGPDLIVEILSEHTENHDRTVKMQLYQRNGVKAYWLIDPDSETLEVYELDDNRQFVHQATYQKDESFQPGIFPDFALTLSDLWA